MIMKIRIRWRMIFAGFLSTTLFAEVPQWWLTRGVIDTNAVSNDYAPVNQGQAKYVVYQAYLEFLQNFGSVGTNITEMVSGFSEDDNSLPVNLGQLKYLAAPFYDQLTLLSATNVWPEGMLVGPYPWSGSANSSQDYAIANIGQLKYLFSFQF